MILIKNNNDAPNITEMLMGDPIDPMERIREEIESFCGMSGDQLPYESIHMTSDERREYAEHITTMHGLLLLFGWLPVVIVDECER